MKNQILFLALFVMAMFASVPQSYGQTAGPLAPLAGTPYTYTVDISGTGYTTGGTYTWFVTTDVDLITAGHIATGAGEIVVTGVGTYDTPVVGEIGKDLTITWTTQAITNAATKPYYLVVKYSEANSSLTTCTASNTKVWEIKPANHFMLAIDYFTGDVGQNGSYCVPDITGAIITPATPATVTYNYGVSTIYAEVTASNYAGDWKPSFRISGIDALQSITSVTWSTTEDFTAGTTHTTALATDAYVSTDLATAVVDGAAKIYVQIVIANNTFENILGQTIKVDVDGTITAGATTLNDVVSDINTEDEAIFGKTTNLTIVNRPTAGPAATGSFITQN